MAPSVAITTDPDANQRNKPHLKLNTKKRKKARKGLEQVYGHRELADRMFYVLQTGKQGLDALQMELCVMLCETIMDMEREDLSGPDWAPSSKGVYKWAYQVSLFVFVDYTN